MKRYAWTWLTVFLLAWTATTGVVAEEPQPIASVGTLKRIDIDAGTVNISHEPVPALGWPAMTMDFRVADGSQLKNLKSGDRVKFEIEKRGEQYVATRVRSAR